MSQIPPTISPSIHHDLRQSQGPATPILSESSDQHRKIRTNVTLNPRDSALDTLPSISWSDLPKAPPNSGYQTTNVSGHANAMTSSNGHSTEGRGYMSHSGRDDVQGHPPIEEGYNAAPQKSGVKSYQNISSSELSPISRQTPPPYKTPMPGYQPISPHKKKKEKVKEDYINLSGRNGFCFNTKLKCSQNCVLHIFRNITLLLIENII